jgi:hypothetical protein
MSDNKSNQQLSFLISYDNWKILSENHTNFSGKRKRLGHYLVKVFSRYNENLGIYCDIKMNYNWFNESRNSKICFWRAKFVCKNCNTPFSYKIKNVPTEKEDICVDLEYTSWNLICKKTDVMGGSNKIKLVNELITKGPLQLKFENTIFGACFPHPESKYICNSITSIIKILCTEIKFCRLAIKFNSELFYKLKHEFKHKERLSIDAIDDARKTKFIYDNLIGPQINYKENYDIHFDDVDNSKIISPSGAIAFHGIQGLIHELKLNPFGYLIISEIQVYISL